MRARWWWAIGAGAGLAIVVAAALIFQPWLLLIDVRVEDEIPSAVATAPIVSDAPTADPADAVTSPPTTPPAGPVDLLTGAFVSHEHATTGAVRVIELPDGSRQLAIEGLETSNGPDVHVWLSAGPVVEGLDGWFIAAGYENVDLGPIKGNLGDQLYDIPPGVDVQAFRTVELWCVQFAVSFGAAALA